MKVWEVAFDSGNGGTGVMYFAAETIDQAMEMARQTWEGSPIRGIKCLCELAGTVDRKEPT